MDNSSAKKIKCDGCGRTPANEITFHDFSGKTGRDGEKFSICDACEIHVVNREVKIVKKK